MLVADQEILLPTTMVGNYPNPRWYDGRDFSEMPIGEFSYDGTHKEAFDDAVGAIVKDQEEAGLDIIADGKVYGGDSPYGEIVYYYWKRMSGNRLTGPPIGLPIYSTLFAPTIVGEVQRIAPFHLAHLRAMRKATRKPIKISYTGIQVLALAANDEYYKDTAALARQIATAYHEDFLRLAEEGVDIIQLDEFVWPYGMSDWEVEVYNLAVDGVPGVQFWTHTCWGNYSGTPGYFPDDGDKENGAWLLDRRPPDAPAPERAHGIFPKASDAHMHVLNYELGRTGTDDLRPLLDNHWDRPFVAGVIDVKSTITETAAEVAGRVREYLKVVPAERLGLTTDCGMINLPRMICLGKLRALVDGVAIVREEVSQGQLPTAALA
ncbi:MAG: cobalamin-independent methionine synthase II family protein [Solirubrobacterales bacterium]|nr:cobalamin-independent methionine synthase II family protein [Solirubrobacterales bacterium]